MLSNANRFRKKSAVVLEAQFSHDLKTAAEIGTPALKGAVMSTVKQVAEICRAKYPPICGFNKTKRHTQP